MGHMGHMGRFLGMGSSIIYDSDVSSDSLGDAEKSVKNVDNEELRY